MELTIIAAVSVVAIVAVSAVSRRIAVAAPLSLVVVGIALSFLPSLPAIDVDPKIILDGALPPLLYAAAVHMPAHDFRRDFKAIAGLAVLLVVLTTVCSGLLFNSLLPGLGLASAFALGAVISPTDAVAASSVGKRLGLPARLLTIVEGEGLVNDASSLVLLSSAVAATTATVHLWKIGVDFVYAVVVAIVIGVVVGYANVRIRSLLKDPVMSTVASFVVPFLAWIPAEELGASGALAAVVAGLVTGHQSPRFLTARDRLAETVNWETVAFLLESGIFLLMGLQLKTLVDQDDVAGLNPWLAVAIGLAAAAVAVVLRVLFVAPLVALLRQDAARGVTNKTQLEQMHERITDPEMSRRLSARRLDRLMEEIGRRIADIDFFVKENLGWRGGGVLAWSGMRGVVTVAAAQSLPDSTPFRPQIVLIAFVVAGTTLLVQGLTLPGVIRFLKITGDDPVADRAAFGALIIELSAQAEAVLGDPALVRSDGYPFDAEVLDRVRQDTVPQDTGPQDTGPQDTGPQDTGPQDTGRPGTAGTPAEADLARREQYRLLMLRILADERAALLVARSSGRYTSRVLGRAQRNLDLREASLQQIADPGSS